MVLTGCTSATLNMESCSKLCGFKRTKAFVDESSGNGAVKCDCVERE